MGKTKKAVVLLSGGLDSATVLAMARSEGFELYALSFRYGQRHDLELGAARKTAEQIGVAEHRIAVLDLGLLGGSALTDDIEVPKNRADDTEIPVTYVPARNTVFLSYALAWAEVLRADDIFIGVNALDYSGYPDCRPEFIEAFQLLAALATKAAVEGGKPVRIHAPLIHMTKAEIVREGLSLGVDYSLTLSCYDPDEEGRACGECDSCRIRLKGFRENHLKDPALYRDKEERT